MVLKPHHFERLTSESGILRHLMVEMPINSILSLDEDEKLITRLRSTLENYDLDDVTFFLLGDWTIIDGKRVYRIAKVEKSLLDLCLNLIPLASPFRGNVLLFGLLDEFLIVLDSIVNNEIKIFRKGMRVSWETYKKQPLHEK